jgi:hypothetical protein
MGAIECDDPPSKPEHEPKPAEEVSLFREFPDVQACSLVSFRV